MNSKLSDILDEAYKILSKGEDEIGKLNDEELREKYYLAMEYIEDIADILGGEEDE